VQFIDTCGLFNVDLGTYPLDGDGQVDLPTNYTNSYPYTFKALYSGDGNYAPVVTQLSMLATSPPVANAGPAIKARKGTTVTVDGTGSSDPQHEPLTYRWEEISGLPATIADKSSAKTAVTLPSKAGTVTLRLTVTNAAGLSSTSDVTITVSPK
jgi:hypothetical protein